MQINKVDPRILWKLQAYKRTLQERTALSVEPDRAGEQRLLVSVTFRGSIDALRNAGFEPRSIEGNIAVGKIRFADMERFVSLDEVIEVEADRKETPNLDVSVPEIKGDSVRTGSPSYTGKGIVMGIVDTGIDIYHHCFRKPDGKTRILFLWDQTLTPGSGQSHPSGFSIGVEFERGDIDSFLATHPEPDKDYPFPSVDTNGHGTHVAGIGAGDGSQSGNCHGANTYIGVAPEADLIIVKTTFQKLDDVDGVKYIFQRASGKNAVVNMSLGTDYGSHDGTSQSEQLIDGYLTGQTGRVVVASAGNSAEANHSHKSVIANGSMTMSFLEYAGNRFSDDFDIWYSGAARLEMTLRSPSGSTIVVAPGASPSPPPTIDGHTVDVSSRINVPRNNMNEIAFRLAPPSGGFVANGTWSITLRDTANVATTVDCWIAHSSRVFQSQQVVANGNASFHFEVSEKKQRTDSCEISYTGPASLSVVVTHPNGTSSTAVAVTPSASLIVEDHIIDIVLAPNEIRFTIGRKQGDEVKTGTWRFTLTETAGQATTVVCRMPEDRTSRPYMVEADRSPSTSVGSPASAQNVIAVGSYDPDSGTLADDSARGPTLDGRTKPDVAAPGVGITAPKSQARGVSICCDCCLSFYVDKQGTSMAAPHVTGVVALLMQKKPNQTFADIRQILRDTARHTVPDSPSPSWPNDNWGWGKVDAQAAVNNITAPATSGPIIPSMILPLAAAWQTYLPTTHRLRELQDLLSSTPTGQLLISLVSKHYDEVFRLIRTVRKVMIAWHRMGGPTLLRVLVSWDGESQRPLVPRFINNRSVADGLEHMFYELKHFGSPALVEDIRIFHPLFRSLPGMHLSNLNFTIVRPYVQTSRNT